MKQILCAFFSLAGACGLWVLLASAQGSEEPPLPAALAAGTSLLDLNLIAGTGSGFASLSADTPVSILEVDGEWLLVEFPNQVGGAAWLNSKGIISFQIRR